MNGMFVTIDGVVGSDVRKTSWNSTPMASFRFVTKERRFDRGTQQWTTVHESWLSVTCFRDLATNVLASITKGDRIVVHGRLRVRQYVSPEGQPRTAVDLEADLVGHDLRYGSTTFTATRSENLDEMREQMEQLVRELHEEGLAERTAGRPRTEPDPDEEFDDDEDEVGELEGELVSG